MTIPHRLSDDRLGDYRPCVGIVLINPAGHIFTARRTDTPDAWQMPQGGIDADEDPRTAALRELAEETGVVDVSVLDETPGWLAYDLPPEIAAKLWGGQFRGQRQKWFACRHIGSDTAIDLSHHSPEFDAWRWSPPDQVLRDIVAFKRAVYRDVLEHFRPYIQAF